LKLLAANDSYTKDSIIKDIKEYIEDLADIGNLHIPNLIKSERTFSSTQNKRLTSV